MTVNIEYFQVTQENLVEEVNRALTYITKALEDIRSYEDRGDTENFDFTLSDFTTDGEDYDLDLSNILPEGAKAVIFRVRVKDGAVDSIVTFRPFGYSSSTKHGYVIRTIVVDDFNEALFIVPLNSKRILKYNGTNLTFTNIDLVVTGWFI